MTIGHGLFLGAALLGMALTFVTEALSLRCGRARGWVLVSWALVAGIALWGLRRRPAESASTARALPLPRLALGAVGVVLAATGTLAFLAPPNNWDSMTYHMPRVAHWSQAGSVAHYPT